MIDVRVFKVRDAVPRAPHPLLLLLGGRCNCRCCFHQFHGLFPQQLRLELCCNGSIIGKGSQCCWLFDSSTATHHSNPDSSTAGSCCALAEAPTSIVHSLSDAKKLCVTPVAGLHTCCLSHISCSEGAADTATPTHNSSCPPPSHLSCPRTSLMMSLLPCWEMRAW